MRLQTSDLLTLANHHCLEMKSGMQDSARLCLDEAFKAFCSGDGQSARNRAIESLRYSIGILHVDYAKATAD